jgi:hypothetical protein
MSRTLSTFSLAPLCQTDGPPSSPTLKRADYLLQAGGRNMTRGVSGGVVVVGIVIIVLIGAGYFYFRGGLSGLVTNFEVKGLYLSQYKSGGAITPHNMGFNLKDTANSAITAVGVEVNGTKATPSFDAAVIGYYGGKLPPGQNVDQDFLVPNAQAGQTYSVAITVTFEDGSYQTYTAIVTASS